MLDGGASGKEEYSGPRGFRLGAGGGSLDYPFGAAAGYVAGAHELRHHNWNWFAAVDGPMGKPRSTTLYHCGLQYDYPRWLASWVHESLLWRLVRGGSRLPGESFPARIRGTAVGLLGAMYAGGLLIGSALRTALITFVTPTVTWLVIAVDLAVGQWMMLLLRKIPLGQDLEAIST